MHNALRLTKSDLQTWARILGRKGWHRLCLAQAVRRPGLELDAAPPVRGVRARRAPRIVPFGPVMVAPVIMAFGTPEQQQRFLPGIMSGDVWVEPGLQRADRARTWRR